MKHSPLFSKDIAPACEYCEHGSPSGDGTMIECAKHGLVSPYFRCKKFTYSPVRRVPRTPQRLPKMSPEDFSL